MDKPNFFSDADVKLLQQVVAREKRRLLNSPPMQITDRWDQGEDHQAPETYIAYPQTVSGIPALVTGDGHQDYDYGYANAYGIYPDKEKIPGSALCDIYQIIDGELYPVGHSELVYNIGNSLLTQKYIPITRDKFGKWIALTVGGVSGNEWIEFNVYQLCPIVPGGTIQAVWAQVTRTSCDTSVTIGDVVLVYDPGACWFNVPVELLATMSGRADLAAGHDEVVLFCAEYRSLGTCYWRVMSLCCYEEPY